MVNITDQILTQNVQTFEQNASILTSHCTHCVVTNIYLYYSYYFTSVLIICFPRTHFIPVNFLRCNLKVWYRLMFLMVHLHTLLHTCSAHRRKISTTKCNVRNSSSILVTASSRKQKKSFVEMLYFFLLNFIIFEGLLQGCPKSSPSACVMRPAGATVNYKQTIRITKLFRRLCILLILIFTNTVREPAQSNGRVPVPSMFGHPYHT